MFGMPSFGNQVMNKIWSFVRSFRNFILLSPGERWQRHSLDVADASKLTKRAWQRGLVTNARSAGIAVFAIGLLSGCGLYIHDPSLQESAEKTRTLVAESDLSNQINGVLTGAADLAKRQEAAVVNFYIMRRNQQLLRLLQPDLLEDTAFFGNDDIVSYVKSGSGYVRNPVDLQTDLAFAINCRLNDLLGAPSITCERDRKINLRDSTQLTDLRNSSFPEVLFTNLAGLNANVKNTRALLLKAIAKHAADNPDLPDDPRGKMACADISAATKATAAKATPSTTDPVQDFFMAYAVACDTAEKEVLAAKPVLQGESSSLLSKVVSEIASLQVERERQQLEGFRLAVEMKDLLKQITTAQGPGPAEAAVPGLFEKVQKALKGANGAAKLLGLRELAKQTDALLQIELTKSAAAASGAKAATSATEQASVKAKGEALLRLASAGATALDAYRDEAPAARAQALIISRVVLTQQIEVAALEVSLAETKLRLLIAQRDFMVNEVHQLAEAGLYRQRPQLGSNQAKLALTRLAASWDTGQIQEHMITYRIFAAERDTSIRISTSNARNLQAAVLAATDQIVAYTKGGLTKEMIADTFAKLFIGGALLK